MAARRNPNIMRAIRLQLKSGFMKTEPPEYTFMKRYPPMHRNTQPTFHEIKTKNIPYLDLLEKAAEANPLYGESVYPAYWQHEPIGLTLAKKQYQFMQQGLDEATAFRRAEEYVDDIESKSYDSLKSLRDAVRKDGAAVPFVNDQELTKELLFWQEHLHNTPYETLEQAEQGEIDHLIQTKILKWNEVERERRMTDPVFFKQFERLRAQLFPLGGAALEKKSKHEIAEYRQRICDLYDVKYSKVAAKAPFYLEEYVNYYKMMKAQPDLNKWTTTDRSHFTKWINDAVASAGKLEGSASSSDRWANNSDDIKAVQKYLETLRHQFFPMLASPKKAAQLPTLTVESLKRTLYESDIGYKVQDGKVFVRRFYRIPALLFPEETLAAALAGDTDKLEHIVSENDEEALLREIKSAGLQDSALPAVMAELKVYLEKYQLSEPDYNTFGSAASSMSALDDLLNDAMDDATELPKRSKGSVRELGLDDLDVLEKQLGQFSDSDSASSSDSDTSSRGTSSSSSDSEAYDSEGELTGEDSDHLPRDPKRHEPITQEMFDRYAKPVRSQLDNDREVHYMNKVEHSFDSASNEYDLMAAQASRLDAEAEERARLESVYQEKESARLKRIWRRNKIWKMPRPVIPVHGMLEV